MTLNGKKLKELADRMLRELDDQALDFAWYSLDLCAERLFNETELRRLRAHAATQPPTTQRNRRKPKIGGNVVAFEQVQR